jgi:aminodeoxyfutalosine deaminase
MSTGVYQARWILPITSPPVENGRLVVQDGSILAVEKAGTPDSSAIDLGDSIVLPGFVNAHAHLMLTCCHRRVPYRGSFTGWLRDLLMAHPRLASGDSARQSLREGLRQSMIGGVTTVADIGEGLDAVEGWADAAINVAGFLEVVGIGPKRAGGHSRTVEAATQLLVHEFVRLRAQALNHTPPAHPNLFIPGLSPHAPYSADARVYREAVACARGTFALCTHLAETREEEQFLRDGTGPFRDLLEQFGLWDGSYEPPDCSPVEYMHRLGLLDLRPLLVHCNYVSDQDLDLIAASRSSVAFCPRSHAFFHHEPHRWREMLTRGINVCIGTDSLASNETLSVLDELRFLRQKDSTVGNEELLTMGTLAGARALGIADQVGSLEAGKRADFVVLPLDPEERGDPSEGVLRGTSSARNIYVGGLSLLDQMSNLPG